MIIKDLISQSIKKSLPIDLLQRGEYQPRQEFDQDSLQELVNSIQTIGVINELIVRPKAPGQYEMIGGERRWRAAQLAGLHELPCKIILCNDEQALQLALIDNLARENLSSIEEARGIQRLIAEFQYTMKELIDILGKPRSTIANLLRLLELHQDVQTLILKQKLTESHGKILLCVSKEKQYFYAKEAIAKDLSTRELDRIIKNDQKNKSLPAKYSSTDIQRLQRHLSDYFGALVVLQANKQNKGFIKITYSDLDALAGILEKMGYQDEE